MVGFSLARALDQPLAAPATQPAVVAAPGAVPVTDPVAAAPASAPADTTGVLGRALQMNSAVNTAADAQLSGSPIAKMMLAEQNKTDAAQAAAAQVVQANQAKADALRTKLSDTAPVEVPRLKPLPEKEVIEHKDPTRAMGQFLPVLVALGALTTSRPGINALNAATAAINAEKTNDKEALEKAHADWLDNMKQTVDNNAQLNGQYQTALANRKAGMDQVLAEINGLAASNQDTLMLSALKGGHMEAITNLLKVRSEAGDQLAGILTKAMDDQTRRDDAKQSADVAYAKMVVDSGKVSMGDAVGPIIAKIARGETPTAGERAAFEEYKDLSQSRQPNFLQMAGQTPGPRPAAAAPAAAAPASPAAPAAKVDPSVLKTQAANAKAAIGRGATKDQARAVWIQQGLPPAEFDRLVR